MKFMKQSLSFALLWCLVLTYVPAGFADAVGENESTAIGVCEEFAIASTARRAKAASEDPITRFAEDLSQAGATNRDNQEPALFHGYYFRLVSSPEMSGGRRKNGGLTLVSYPAQYQLSGVMTFVVTKRGLVYKRDLGQDTATVAQRLKHRNGRGWLPAA